MAFRRNYVICRWEEAHFVKRPLGHHDQESQNPVIPREGKSIGSKQPLDVTLLQSAVYVAYPSQKEVKWSRQLIP